jgi:hypothetical protein
MSGDFNIGGNVTGSNVNTGNMSGSTINIGGGGSGSGSRAKASSSPERPKDPDPTYHLAFTFAGEQRDYVRSTKEQCEDLGLRVMYDFDLSIDWWGKSYVEEQRKIYSARTLFVVPFISADYIRKPIPRDEFRTAMWTDIQQGGGYILPVLMDGAHPPVEMLLPSVAFMAVNDGTPSPGELALSLNEKVLSSLLAQPRPPRPLREFVQEGVAPSSPTDPVVDPVTQVLGHVRSRLEAERATVRNWGGSLELEHGEDVRSRAVLGGTVVHELTVRKIARDAGKLAIGVHRHNGGGELQEKADVIPGKYGESTKVRLTKDGLLRGVDVPVALTKEELFDRIWSDIRARMGR